MNSILSRNIRFLRKQKKMSQQELGDKLERSESTIQMWESDQRSPQMATVIEIAKIFGVDVNTLVYTDLSEGEKPILLNVQSIHPQTIAAHFDGDEYTKDELEEIKKFAEFVKQRRNKQ